MQNKSKLLVIAGAAALCSAAPSAIAVPFYSSTNQTTFDAGRPGIATYNFPYQSETATSRGNYYTYGGVTFGAPGYDFSTVNDGTYGSKTYYAADYGQQASLSYLYVGFSGPVLGLTLASYYGAQTLSYTVTVDNFYNYTGTVTLGANRTPTFIGFDAGQAVQSLSIRFALSSEVDVLGFQTAVPEAGTWAMMMVGLGVVGGSLRRRQKVNTRVSFA